MSPSITMITKLLNFLTKFGLPVVAIGLIAFAVRYMASAKQRMPVIPPPVQPAANPFANSVAGAGMVGAALLAARAALRLGAGRVYVDCIGAPELRVDPLQPELMFRRHASLAELDCIVVGCGLGTDTAARAALSWAIAQSAALVVDADALNLVSAEPSLRDALRARPTGS